MAAIKALQQWCKQQCDGYRDVSVTNMTTSFRDGLAFCAILHKHRPDLINFNSLSKENVYENNHLAFRVAEEQLGIPALLDAEDMVKLRVPDRLSILTYVSQYYNYFHGRSPIGGIAAVKRPPPDSIEEPAGKKITNHAAPSPQTTPAKQGPQKSTAVIENAPVRAGIREINPNSEVSSNCAVCGKHVHLVQRHMADGKLYHRNCFRCKQCTRTLQPGSYRPGDQPGTLVCTHHVSHSPSQNTSNVSSSGPYTPVMSSVGGNYTSPALTVRPNSPTNKPWQNTTSPYAPATNNRTAVGFANHSKNSSAVDEKHGKNMTHNLQSESLKDSPSSANARNNEPTNKTAIGFYGNSKANGNALNGPGVSDQLNKPVSNYLGINKDKTVSNMSGGALNQANSPTSVYLQTTKGKIDSNSPLSRTNSYQRDAKKELWQVGQQSNTSGATGNVPSVSSIAAGRSSTAKDETKEQNTTPKSWTSSTAKNKEARDAFFQLKPVSEPTANQYPSGRESPKVLVSNGPGRFNVTPRTPEVHHEKDKARSFLLKNIPGSTSPKPARAAENVSTVSTPNRTPDPHPRTAAISTPKTEPVKPVPKERKSKGPTSITSPQPPESTQTYSNSKGPQTPSFNKSGIPAQPSQPPPTSHPAQPSQPPQISHPTQPSQPPQISRPPQTSHPAQPSQPPQTSHLAQPSRPPQTSHPSQPSYPAQPSQLTPGRVQKVTDPSPKTQAPTVSKSETPADWRSMLKSVDKKPSTQRTIHEVKIPPKEPDTPTAQNKPISVVTVTISPTPGGKENKPTPPAISTATPSPVVVTVSSTAAPSKKKLLPVKIDLINDWLPKPEQKWQDGDLGTEEEAPKWRSHLKPDSVTSKYSSTKDKTSTDKLGGKPSNSTLVENHNLASPNKLRPEYIPEEAIQRQLQIIEQELDSLEQRGVELEKQLRVSDGDEPEDFLMVDWFKLIHKKQLLLREESELNYISRQQALENQQQDVETELRNLMNKPEHLKTELDKTREQTLLDKYLLIVNDRSEIIECLDEDRLREKEEDEVMENMIKKHSDTQQKQPSSEPNLKRRSRFSFSGFLKTKDKNKT